MNRTGLIAKISNKYVLPTDKACNVDALSKVLERCAGLLRCKGVVRAPQGGWQVIQWSGGRLETSATDVAPREAALVYIGVGTSPDDLDASLQRSFG